jgi:hypothetical protein
MMEGSGLRSRIRTGDQRIREAQKHTDSDLQHCSLERETYKEYEPCWLDKGFSPHLTGLYIFSRLLIQVRVDHPPEAFF